MVQPYEESLDEAPDSPPHVPLNFMNGFRSWHIVIDPDGQEVIELVSSDEEEEEALENPPENLEPMAAFWDIEMGHIGVNYPNVPLESSSDSSDSEDDDVGGVKEVGVQCDIWKQGKGADSSESDNTSIGSELSEDESARPGPSLGGYVCGGRGRFCLRGYRSRPFPGNANVCSAETVKFGYCKTLISYTVIQNLYLLGFPICV